MGRAAFMTLCTIKTTVKRRGMAVFYCGATMSRRKFSNIPTTPTASTPDQPRGSGCGDLISLDDEIAQPFTPDSRDEYLTDNSNSDYENESPRLKDIPLEPPTPVTPGQGEEAAIRAAIERSKEAIYEDEQFISGWPVISINQWDVEQERILILTDRAYYRVKYNFSKKEITRFERTELSEVRALQKGSFHSRFSRNNENQENRNSYGMRVYVGEDRTNPFAKKQYFRTYCAAIGPNVRPGKDQKEATLRICSEFLKARQNIAGGEGTFYMSENEIHRNKPLGAVSMAMNRLKVGYFNKRRKSKSDDQKNGLLLGT